MSTSPSRKLFVNLPVADLKRSVAFFSALGFSFDDEFTDETSTCLVIGDSAFAMLLERDRFAEFAPRPIAHARSETAAIYAVEVEDVATVDGIADRALAAGGSPANDPMEHEFMYGRSFHDPDGHMWEVFWLDAEASDDSEE